MNTLKVENINFKYGANPILKNISFNLHDGLIGILGPNGCGKSTLVKLITTTLPLQNGEMIFNNNNYRTSLTEIRKTIGYLPQKFNAYPQLTGREFLEFIYDIKYGRNKVNKSSQLDKIVFDLNMDSFQNKKVKTYSGGMKQRLGIAQSLIGNPKLIVIDEPTTGLDPSIRNEFRKLLPVISKDRLIIMTTHLTEDIGLFCNQLIILKAGKILFNGTSEEVLHNCENDIWTSTITLEQYQSISEKINIIKNISTKDGIEITYISKEKFFSNSKLINPSLENAYLYYQNKML